MTHIEAMKQALEALEWATGCMSFDDYDDMPEATESLENAHKVITSLRQAIATEESSATQEPVAWMFQHNETGRITFVETQQIEWGWEKGNPQYTKIGPLYTHPQPKAEQCLHRLVDVTNPVVKSGYMCIDCGAVFRAAFESQPKAEPKREPLTEDERFQLRCQWNPEIHGALHDYLIHQTEAAHGIKGEA